MKILKRGRGWATKIVCDGCGSELSIAQDDLYSVKIGVDVYTLSIRATCCVCGNTLYLSHLVPNNIERAIERRNVK